ncbi:MAG: hypothetical protein V3U88_10030 [Methylococcales bacterium]
MHLINASRWLAYFTLAVVLFVPMRASHAEWIKARSIGASNHIWINTESNALFAGDSCRPLMKLKYLSGNKPRSLRQRQQIYRKRPGNNRNADKQVEFAATQDFDQSNHRNTNSAAIGVANQDARAAITPLDPLNLSYQTQPEFDPLNRNQFNISINDNSIALTSQHSRIKARIIGRYDRRSECGS